MCDLAGVHLSLGGGANLEHPETARAEKLYTGALGIQRTVRTGKIVPLG